MKKILLFIRNFILSLLVLVIICAGALLYTGYQRYLDEIDNYPVEVALTNIEADKDFVSYDDISKDLTNALVAIEDHRFFLRDGIDIIAIARAFITNLNNKTIAEGGSTITQQLAKNIYFNHNVSLTRKVAEIFFVYDIESKFSKQKILSYYANIIYYGDGYYGIKKASEGYFHKDCSELTLFEASLLAGLPQSPSNYQLSSGLDLALKRQQQVLKAMYTYDFISEKEYNDCLNMQQTFNMEDYQ